MTRIVGTSDQIEDIRDGTLSRHKMPPPADKHATGAYVAPGPGVHAKIDAIRQSQENIRTRISEIQSQLEYLDQKHIPDSQPWISFAPASNIEDLKPKFPSLREALKNDLQVLRDQLRFLADETRTARRSGLRGTALAATGEFDRDLEQLVRNAKVTGRLDDHLLQRLRIASQDALRKWRAVVDNDPSPQNLKGLMAQIRQDMLVGLGDSAGVVAALISFGNGIAKIKQSAEKRFRANPTVENLKDYLGKTRTSLLVGGEGITGMPAGQKRLRPEKSYVVKPGDSLSSISKLFYGTEGLWDFIYFPNLKVIGDNPERLRPGIELQIP